MSDTKKDAQRPSFDELWDTIPDHAELERAGVLDTLGFGRAPTVLQKHPLPSVDHLIELGPRLGAGGSGEVLSANQKSLGRDIAVKRTRDGASDAELSGLLLMEARVIGYLEHPNIPPVHFVGTGLDDELLVGMKRIEGQTLDSLLGKSSLHDSLDENLDILVDVCNAVGFAHERGILHLDLKPENVMVGGHGEVYVVDWGLAVAYRDDLPAFIPRPWSDLRGTPGFIAPETVFGEPATAATDIYQLGGILHCLLTGEAPNRGSTVVDALRDSYDPSPRTFKDRVPVSLARICSKALAVQPRDRFASVAEFREALIAHARNRRAAEAESSARRQLAVLLKVLEPEEAGVEVVYQQYGATRQAIEELAHETDDASSKPLLQSVLESMIRWELTRKNVGGASLLLRQLPLANEAIAKEVEEQSSRQELDREELRALRHDVDLTVGRTAKSWLVVALGAVICAISLAPGLFELDFGAKRVLAGYLVYLAILGLATLILRKHLLVTTANRALISLVWKLTLFGLVLRIGHVAGLLSLRSMIGLDLALVTLVGGFAAFIFDRRVRYSVPVYAAATLVTFLLPADAMLVFGLAHLLGLTTLGLMMRRGGDDESAL